MKYEIVIKPSVFKDLDKVQPDIRKDIRKN